MAPFWSNRVNHIFEAEAVKARVMIFTSRRFIFLLVLGILLDWQWRADGAHLENASELNVSEAELMNVSELEVSRSQLINESMFNVTLPPGLDLSNQNKTLKNFNVPLPVYISVPLVTVAISGCLIYGFCWWKMKLDARRKNILEKQNTRRRRSSLKPGSSERGKKFGLTRAVGPDGDPLIIPKTRALSLARKLEDVEQLVLDYNSLDMGDRLPEKHLYNDKEETYNISINPMFNSLQSGACGYVLTGDDDKVPSKPGAKKPEKDPDDDSDSEGRPKKSTSKKLDAVKRASITSLPRFSKESAESKSKDDPLQRSLATKSLFKEVKRDAKVIEGEESADESSDDANSVASSIGSEASSVESLDSGATSEEEWDDKSVMKPGSSKSPPASRLSKMSSPTDTPPRTSLSRKPGPKENSSGAGPSDYKVSLSPRVRATLRASKATALSTSHLSSSESEADSGEESSTASPSTRSSKSAASGEDLKRSSLKSKSSEIAEAVQKSQKAILTSKASKEESPSGRSSPRSSKAFSPLPHPKYTPRTRPSNPADSSEVSRRSSLSTKSFEIAKSVENTHKAILSSLATKEESPTGRSSPRSSKAFSSSPRKSSTPRRPSVSPKSMEIAKSVENTQKAIMSSMASKEESPMGRSSPRSSKAFSTSPRKSSTPRRPSVSPKSMEIAKSVENTQKAIMSSMASKEESPMGCSSPRSSKAFSTSPQPSSTQRRPSVSPKSLEIAKSVENTQKVMMSSLASKEESPTGRLSPGSSKAFSTSPQPSSTQRRPSVSPKSLEIAKLVENTQKAIMSSLASKEKSPTGRLSPRSSKAFSSSPRSSSTPRASMKPKSGSDSPHADSGEDSPRSSSAPRASKATVPGDGTRRIRSPLGTDSENDSKTSSPESSARKPRQETATPKFSTLTTSSTEQKNSSIKKSDWDPKTVRERSSIKKISSRSQVASRDKPSSPRVSP